MALPGDRGQARPQSEEELLAQAGPVATRRWGSELAGHPRSAQGWADPEWSAVDRGARQGDSQWHSRPSCGCRGHDFLSV